MKSYRAIFCLAPVLLFMSAAPALALGPLIVFFAASSDVISPQSQAILQNTAQVFARTADEPGVGIILTGHTDQPGAPAANLRLSCRRAAAVRAVLIRLGVPRERIAVQGYGETRPLVDTADGVAEAQNRRVEIGFSNAQGLAAARTGPHACGDQPRRNGG